ncbi:GNAT family N-acetyltransferase [Streptomyces sp. G45]|uniref:GNAT family N-acetyltransferase n=1 Tax=Streptomyces sp. G45 TaxID=3406627 RepID=UPI003C285C69
MTELLVRAVRPGDAADATAFAAIRRACLPALLTNAAAVLFEAEHAHPEAHYLQLLAEADGTPIGTGQVGVAYDSPEPGQGFANVYVLPEHRGRGAGSLLLRTAEEHLAAHGAGTVFSWALEGPRNRAFAERRGYRASRSAHFLRLDLAAGELPPLDAPPPGVELRTAADFAADPRLLFRLDAETTADEPGDVAADLQDYEQWLMDTWNHPMLDRALTVVAVVDGRPAAFTAARTDGAGRYLSGMTGTARAHRGRGLATLVKTASLHRARAAGCTEAFTGNDADNAPMLAVNKRLGYEICDTEVRHVRALG